MRRLLCTRPFFRSSSALHAKWFSWSMQGTEWCTDACHGVCGQLEMHSQACQCANQKNGEKTIWTSRQTQAGIGHHTGADSTELTCIQQSMRCSVRPGAGCFQVHFHRVFWTPMCAGFMQLFRLVARPRIDRLEACTGRAGGARSAARASAATLLLLSLIY